MSDDSRLEEFDNLLADKPASSTLWEEVCAALEAHTDDVDSILGPHINTLLEDWPDAARVVPPGWVDRLLEGEPVPHMIITRTLDLRRQQISTEDADVLADASELHWIHRLNLAYNGIHDDGCVALTQTDALQSITWLDLAGNSVETRGVEALARCEHLRNLTHLDLTGNWVDDAAATYLANSEVLATLDTLILRGNPIREAGAEALANSPYLNASICERWADD